MAINFNCPGCGRAFSVDAHIAGSQAQCNSCGTVILVPAVQPVVDLQPHATITSAAPVVELRPAQSATPQAVGNTATGRPGTDAASIHSNCSEHVCQHDTAGRNRFDDISEYSTAPTSTNEPRRDPGG